MSEYVILQEQDFDQDGDMYFFIKWNGNEKNLTHLHSQMKDVEWDSEKTDVFYSLDIENKVSVECATQMCKVELNKYFHRKFDGELKQIDFKIKPTDKMSKKMRKIVETLQSFEDFIDGEDYFGKKPSSDDSSDSEDENKESSSDSDSEKEEEQKEQPKKQKKQHKLPQSVLNKLKQQK